MTFEDSNLKQFLIGKWILICTRLQRRSEIVKLQMFYYGKQIIHSTIFLNTYHTWLIFISKFSLKLFSRIQQSIMYRIRKITKKRTEIIIA